MQCEQVARGVTIDPPPSAVCSLPLGHKGAHSWEIAAQIAQNIIKLGEWKGKGYESEITRIAAEAITQMQTDYQKRIDRLISMNPEERSAAMKEEISRLHSLF